MAETKCKPVEIERTVKETGWFGCPVGTHGRNYFIYGIVIHSLTNAQFSAVRNSMLASSISTSGLTPVTSANGISSVHYMVGLQVEQFVDDNDVAWAAGYKCNFDLAPVIPPPEDGYPGWSFFPPTVHIAENCLHIAVNMDLPQSSWYDALVRLIRHLSDTHSIPLDVRNVSHYREITRNNSIPAVDIPNVIVDAELLCDRCCESLEDITPEEDIHAIKAVDVYGCEALMDIPSSDFELNGSGCICIENGNTVRLDIDPSECNNIICGINGLKSVYPSFSKHTVSFWTKFDSNDVFVLEPTINDEDNTGVWSSTGITEGINSSFEQITNDSCHPGFLDVQLYQSNQTHISGDGHLALLFSWTVDGGATWIPYSITHQYAFRNEVQDGVYMNKMWHMQSDIKRWFWPIGSGQTLTLGTKVELAASNAMPADEVTVYGVTGFHRVTATIHHYPP